jgi:hypothetical protein
MFRGKKTRLERMKVCNKVDPTQGGKKISSFCRSFCRLKCRQKKKQRKKRKYRRAIKRDNTAVDGFKQRNRERNRNRDAIILS